MNTSTPYDFRQIRAFVTDSGKIRRVGQIPAGSDTIADRIDPNTRDTLRQYQHTGFEAGAL